MFSVIPPHFLPDVKNPCWYEELHGNVSADPYGSNLFSRLFSQMRVAFKGLSATFRQRLILRNGKLQRLRCLPYFYIIGQPKCGTTDLYERLRLHPDVYLTGPKEPHWWSRKRFGEWDSWRLNAFKGKLLSSALSLQTKCSGRSSITTEETKQK